MIAIALLMAVQAAPVTETHGPFVIEREWLEDVGFPYMMDLKTTTLKWKAQSGLATYELSDTGENITSTSELPTASCSRFSRHRRLVRTLPGKFGEDLLSLKCGRPLSPEQIRILRSEIASARPHFARAYDIFYRRTIEQHGFSRQRCRETSMGNHGPICEAYWDKGIDVRAQGKGKRP
ncbi:MAG TPA: hypothetical protein VE053_03965 [Allosphingosinicella sp.]|nr:hypothetical protein [Allosphingosinicella sp.]